jgi:pimeloyl-ACP methyl ester carboxylesterase
MRKMKKAALYTALGITLAAAVNRLIFTRARGGAHKEADEKIFKWKHGRVHYTVSGQGKPVLLIHGIGRGRSGAEWEAAAGLLARKRRVYNIDLLGFGQSDTPALDYSAYLYVTLINDFIRRIIRGTETTVIAEGRSAAYALMAGAFSPGHFNRIILVAPEGLDKSEPRRRWADGILRGALAAPVLGTALYNAAVSHAAINRYARTLCKSHTGYRRVNAKLYAHAHAGGSGARFVLRSLATGLLDADIRRILTQTQIPLLVIGSQHVTDEARRLCPLAKTVVRTTGGLIYWENPQSFYQLCKPFLP